MLCLNKACRLHPCAEWNSSTYTFAYESELLRRVRRFDISRINTRIHFGRALHPDHFFCSKGRLTRPNCREYFSASKPNLPCKLRAYMEDLISTSSSPRILIWKLLAPMSIDSLARLEISRKELLDLGLRNPLINHRSRAKQV